MDRPREHDFGEEVAARYDEILADQSTPAAVEPVVDFLSALAGDGPALEFGVGTGRIALPLAARGVQVHGIDLSPAMVARLREKPGGHEVTTTIGDFATTRVPGEFALVYLLCNTIMNLTSQAAQVACFNNAAAHLAPGGTFVINVVVPDLRRLPPGETMVVFDHSATHVGIDEYDVANQGVISHHYRRIDGELRYSSAPFRYVWPGELDLMAEMAGLTFRERWEGWKREPFTSESRRQLSAWTK
jgi:SAM-dependent methyltransferase